MSEHSDLHQGGHLDLVGWVRKLFDQTEELVAVVLGLKVVQVYQAQTGIQHREWEAAGIGYNDSSFLASIVLLVAVALHTVGVRGDEKE